MARRNRGRRAHGEGSVFFRPDRQRWIVRLPGASKARSFTTEKAALAHLITARHEQKAGTLIEPSRLTVSGWLAEWLQTRTTRLQLAPASVLRYQRSIDRITPHLGAVKLGVLTGRHIEDLIGKLEAQGETRNTIGMVYADLRLALRSARKAKVIALDVTDDVDAPKGIPREDVMRSLTDDEARALIVAAKQDDALGALWMLGLTTGARRGEMLALTWTALDLIAGTMKITQGIQRANAQKWRLGRLKTAAARRELALTAETIDALRSHQRRQKALCLKLGRPWDAKGFVFQCAETGAFLTPNRAAYAHRGFIKTYHLAVHRFHDLRHSCATLLLKHGENVHVVAKQLGHASAMMTLKHYSHCLPDQRQGVAVRMSKLLAG